MALEWCLAPHFLVRSAGFPLGWLDRLVCPDAVAHSDFALAEETKCVTLAENLDADWTRDWPKPDGLRLKTFRKHLKNRKPFDLSALPLGVDARFLNGLQAWNDALDALGAASNAQSLAVDLDIEQARAKLFAQFQDTLVQEAVFLSSPSVYKNVLCSNNMASAKRNARTRRAERQLMQYLQRLCAKNETTSFFGPINYGRLGQDCIGAKPSLPVLPPKTDRPPAIRKTFVANWVVQELARVAEGLSQVQDACAPRLDYGCRLETGRLHITAVDRFVTVSPDLEAFLRSFDPDRSLADCAQHAGITPDQARAKLAPLLSKGLVRIGIPLVATDPDPLCTLRAFLDAMPSSVALAPIRKTVQDIDDLRNHFSAADLRTKADIMSQCGALFSAQTGMQDSRAGGSMYADRTVLYEECRGDLGEIELDAALVKTVTQSLSPWFNAWTAIAAQKRDALNPVGLALWDTVFGAETKSVSFSAFLHKVTRHPTYNAFQDMADETEATAQANLLAPMQALIADAAIVNPTAAVEISQSCLEEITRSTGPPDEAGLFVSPDIMLASNADGGVTTILGEAHDTVMVWGWALGFHERPTEIAQNMWDFLAPNVSADFANVVSAQRVKIVPFEYPGTSILMRAPSSETRNHHVNISEVQVSRGVERLELCTTEGRKLRLYNGELETFVHRLFALPKVTPPVVEIGPRTPRLTFGSLVAQRARWRLMRGSFGLAPAYDGNLAQLALDARRARIQAGMPERVFMKSPTETKPVLIDFRSLHSLEMLDSFFTADTPIVFTEMLPDGDALWLPGRDGLPHTCELRCTFVAGAPTPTIYNPEEMTP